MNAGNDGGVVQRLFFLNPNNNFSLHSRKNLVIIRNLKQRSDAADAQLSIVNTQ